MGTCVFFTGYVGLFWQDHQIKSYSLRMIQPNFGSNWLSHFRGDSIVNSLQMDDGCLVMAKAHSELVSDCCLMPTQQFFSYITRPEHVNFQ